jgi:hypothetical protein
MVLGCWLSASDILHGEATSHGWVNCWANFCSESRIIWFQCHSDWMIESMGRCKASFDHVITLNSRWFEFESTFRPLCHSWGLPWPEFSRPDWLIVDGSCLSFAVITTIWISLSPSLAWEWNQSILNASSSSLRSVLYLWVICAQDTRITQQWLKRWILQSILRNKLRIHFRLLAEISLFSPNCSILANLKLLLNFNRIPSFTDWIVRRVEIWSWWVRNCTLAVLVWS